MRGAKASFFMRYRKLDRDGDSQHGSGSSDFHINTPEAVAQSIRTRLGLWMGEWFADISDGTGWNQSILGKQTKNLYELTLRQRVLETRGVLSIDEFSSSLNQDKRRLSVYMVVTTIYGNATLNEDIVK